MYSSRRQHIANVLPQTHMQVRWDDFSQQQLEEHLLWTYVDPKDGEYVQPVDTDFSDGRPLEDLLLSTQFTFRDGTKHIGFVHGTEGEFDFSEHCFGNLSPFVILSDSHSLNLFAFPPRSTESFQDVQMEYRAQRLGCDVLDIYPIDFSVTSPVAGAVSHGVIPGLMFYRIVRKQTFFRRSKTVLVTQIPNADLPKQNVDSGNPYHPPRW